MRTEGRGEPHVRCRNRLVETFQRFFSKIVSVVQQVFPPLVLLLVVFKPAVTFAQGAPQHALVRFTGAFQLVEEKGRSHVPTLTVRISETRWLFRSAKIENLSGGYVTPLRLFQALVPRRAHFVGSEDLLRPLRDSGITGRRLNIEGYLYTADRVLWVTAVEEIAWK